jgi:hypothetical protein
MRSRLWPGENETALTALDRAIELNPKPTPSADWS